MDRSPDPSRWRTWRRRVAVSVLALLGLSVAWWAAVRVTAGDRSLQVHGDVPAVAADTGAARALDADTIRVLAWNIAHGRGDLRQGSVQNFRGGTPEERIARLARIAAVIRDADADVVALNEVDFQAAWSGEVNQAEVLARAAGYPVRVEQRNFDYSLLFWDFAFGNAVLSRLPVRDARPVPIPPHSRLEAIVIGAKTAAVVVLGVGDPGSIGPAAGARAVAVVPVHLEFRDEDTRLAAVAPLQALQDHAPPLILAGDFNTAPPGWPGTDAASATALGRLMDAGWSSPRAAGDPGAGELTFPSPDPRRAIDWVLAEPPLRVLEARVLTDHPELSDHLPVLAVVELR